MTLTAHLSYSGQCREAFNFYAQLFGGELMMLAYGDTPMANDVPHDCVLAIQMNATPLMVSAM